MKSKADPEDRARFQGDIQRGAAVTVIAPVVRTGDGVQGDGAVVANLEIGVAERGEGAAPGMVRSGSWADVAQMGGLAGAVMAQH